MTTWPEEAKKRTFDYDAARHKGRAWRWPLLLPVTHFDDDGNFKSDSYANMCSAFGFEAPVLFAAGGTGEFFSLTPSEVPRVVAAAKEAAARQPSSPVALRNRSRAVEIARSVEKVGADGILLLPHYLIDAPQEGMYHHVKRICQSVRHRRHGLQPGQFGSRRGNPAAALRRMPQSDWLQVTVPVISVRFARSQRHGRSADLSRRHADGRTLRGGYLGAGSRLTRPPSSISFRVLPSNSTRPCELVSAARARPFSGLLLSVHGHPQPPQGLCVSAIKAGVRLQGFAAGKVRAPLDDLTAEEEEMLAKLISPWKR